MRMLTRAKNVVMLAAVVGGFASAQELTLKEAIALAAQSYPEIRAARAERAGAESGVALSGSFEPTRPEQASRRKVMPR